MTDIVADFELDVRGECCPYPLIRTKKQVDSLQPGEILKVIADDPVAPRNIDQWSKLKRHNSFNITGHYDYYEIRNTADNTTISSEYPQRY